MKQPLIILSILFLFFTNGIRAQVASEFLSDHITTFHDLHNSSNKFDQELLYVKNIESAKKSIDDFNLQIEKSISIYSKHKGTNDDKVNEVTIDLTNLLSDILKNNYQLLGLLIKEDYSKENLKKDCFDLVNKKQRAANFFKEISLGVCMSLTKVKPKGAKENEQFIKLTEIQRDSINKLLISKFGKTIKKGKEVESQTSFEYSCRLIYEFINMKWVFKK